MAVLPIFPDSRPEETRTSSNQVKMGRTRSPNGVHGPDRAARRRERGARQARDHVRDRVQPVGPTRPARSTRTPAQSVILCGGGATALLPCES